MDYDIVIRGGTIFDGSGDAPFEADIGIKEGRISAVGAISTSAADEIDARGRIVTPGFVDVHTHYDAQASWDNRMAPSTLHGVTTAAMGNCGVGFAPCGEEHREMLLRLMEGVEDIPQVTMAEGIPWRWESFPEYLDFLASRSYDVDLGAYLPHSALRIYVMGRRGADREPATRADLAQMAQIAEDAMRAGALGFSTSRMSHHRDANGALAPSVTAGEEELRAIGLAMKRAGRGIWQLNNDFYDTDAQQSTEFDMLRRLVRESGRPLSFTLNQKPGSGDAWKTLLRLTGAANAEGLPITGQVFPRSAGSLFGLQLAQHPFKWRPSFAAIADLPLARQVEALRDPAMRSRLLAEAPEHPNRNVMAMATTGFKGMFPLGDPPQYEPKPEDAIGPRAQRMGIDPLALAYDLLLENDGRNLLFLPATNYADGDLEASREMMMHENTVIGLGDGGAHYASISDASYPTFLLAYWARERTRGERIDLPWAVRALTSDPATLLGLHDRGTIAVGMKADINVIDYDRLQLHAPTVVTDLPGGSARLMQRAIGYDATVLSGVTTYRHGESTGQLPGKLLRGTAEAVS